MTVVLLFLIWPTDTVGSLIKPH